MTLPNSWKKTYKMNYPKIKTANTESLNDFITFWSKQYHYPKLDKLYPKSIDKEEFEEDDIFELYKWKNGMKLSDAKKKSINKNIISELPAINNFKKQEKLVLEAFKTTFKNVSAVWKIFLLHIIKPKKYPIYDQHIHRAYLYVNNAKEWENLSETISDKKKEEFYFGTYLEFIEANKNEIESLKKLDEAFFAFGQFLKTRKYSTLLA